jgi:hypothetical protein
VCSALLAAIDFPCAMDGNQSTKVKPKTKGNYMFRFFVAGVFLVLFCVGAMADKSTYLPVKVCSPEADEGVLLMAIKEAPELVMAEVEGTDLELVFNRMEFVKMMMGKSSVDKMYAFYSENHPKQVYVFFVIDHCIVDVSFTYRNLVEYFLTGDQTLIKPQE